MQLFQLADDPYCHRVRLVIAEKQLSVDLTDCDTDTALQELRCHNPWSSIPTLIDRDVRLHDSRVIIEYLDERYPSPPLMPIEPAARAQVRLAMAEVERDWYDVANFIRTNTDPLRVREAQKDLLQLVMAASVVLVKMPFFLSQTYSLLDATALPILCRLDQYGIAITDETWPIARYMRRALERTGFAWATAGKAPVAKAKREPRGSNIHLLEAP